jgi:type IV secretion system protein VirB3
MSDEQTGLEIDKLFKGLTRPPMIAGVSYAFVMLNLMSMLAFFVMTSKLWIFLLAIVVHFIGYLICREEPLFLELIALRLQKFNKCSNKLFHRGNSYDIN